MPEITRVLVTGTVGLRVGDGQFVGSVAVEEFLVLGVADQQRNADAAVGVDRPVLDDVVKVRATVQVGRTSSVPWGNGVIWPRLPDHLPPCVPRDINVRVLPRRAREVERVGGGNRTDGGGPRLVVGGPDGVRAREARAPVVEPVEVDLRLTFLEVERRPDVKRLVRGVDGASHVAYHDQIALTLAPPAVV